jgi:molybdate transport system regulatory protein
MPKKSEIRARLRIILGEEIALGPGKFELTLIRIMNRCFREPLVIAARGGSKGGGGAQLTDAGRKVLALYEQMNAKSLAAAQPEWGKLQKLLRS